MKFFDKLKKVIAANIAYSVILLVSLILFMYFAGGDLIAGILTAISAVVAYVCIALLYQEYKALSVKPVAVAPVVAKKAAVKSVAKKAHAKKAVAKRKAANKKK